MQGVGYRYFTVRIANQLGLGGWVANRPDGTVEAELVGPADLVAEAIESLQRGPAFARVENLDVSELPFVESSAGTNDAASGFEVRY